MHLPVPEAAVALKEKLREWAQQVGFDLVGVASVDPLREAERLTMERLRSGMLDGMAWITEERIRLSCNPAALLPGARSVIALASCYLPAKDDAPEGPQGPAGRIARYALGEDYHEAFPPMMARLLDLVHRSTGRRPMARLMVDSGPLAEKAVAARAGIGWYGRNGCLLTEPFGSWVLLAEIVTDLKLEPDSPRERDCGGCRLCMDCCPAGAIVSPGVVDARRCMSYLTIEHRGVIPLHLRPSMGSRIFGCDTCQEVCPHNQAGEARMSSTSLGRPRLGSSLPLAPLLGLDRAGFGRLFRGSPVLRSRRRGLLRNVAVALGNSRDPVAATALIRALKDEEWLVRSHAAWALGEIGGASNRSALEGALAAEADERVRGELRMALDR